MTFNTEEWLKHIYFAEIDRIHNNAHNRVEQLLSINGDGTGGTNMINEVNVYKVAPPPGEVFIIERLNIYVEVAVNAKFSAAKYGASAALSNGILLTVQNTNGNIITLSPLPIKKIGHWNLLAGIDAFYTDFPSGAADMAAVRITFGKAGGSIWLDGDNGEYLSMNIQDNLGGGGAALVEHYAKVQGNRFVPPGWWHTILPRD